MCNPTLFKSNKTTVDTETHIDSVSDLPEKNVPALVQVTQKMLPAQNLIKSPRRHLHTIEDASARRWSKQNLEN